MSLPITHYLYLALALFAVGFGGALLRRSLIAALLGVQLMLVSVALLLAAYARFYVDVGGQRAALAVVLVGLVELAIAAAVVLRLRGSGEAEQTGQAGVGLAWLADWTAPAGHEHDAGDEHGGSS